VTTQDIAADKAAAEAASLKLADFPAGWTSQPSSSSTATNNDEKMKADLYKCLGVTEASMTHSPASYDSPDFADSDDHTASSTVGYRATSADQQKAFEPLSDPKFSGCLSSTFAALMDEAIKHPTDTKDTIPEGVTLGKTTVSPMSFPQFGDKSVAYQVEIPISYKGLDFNEFLGAVFAIKGRADVSMTFESSGDPFPVDQAQHYTGLVVGRLTNT
jgi:hypothetical protein